MAGFYPDVPGHRFAYDMDGTILRTTLNDGGPTNIDGYMTDLNNEDYSTNWSTDETGTRRLAFVFPELRNLDGYFVCWTRENYWTLDELEYSTDTTDGHDGSWSIAEDPWNRKGAVDPYYRDSINTLNLTGIKGIRFVLHNSSYTRKQYFRAVHLYGSIPSGENPDRLRFWHPSNDQEIDPAHFDWGDIPQGASQTRQFRIKNNSTSMTANNISLATGALTHAMDDGLQFSADDTTYSSTLNIGDLAAEAVSGVVYVKRNVSASATARLQAARIKASAESFS